MKLTILEFIKKIVLILKVIIFGNIILVFFLKLGNAQCDSISKKNEIIFFSFINTQKNIYSSPLSIKIEDLKYLIPLGVITSISIYYDEDINRKILRFRAENPIVGKVSPFLTYGGEIPFLAGTSGLMYLSGFVFNDQKIKQTGAITAYALVNSAVVVTILKMTFGRQRPFIDGNSNWHFFPKSLKQFDGEESGKFTSFPSGHSIAAWTLATVIAQQYSENFYIPIIAYTFATGVSLSRTTENTHWLSDIIIGSALGYGIGKYAARMYKNTKWFLIPSQNGGILSITGIYKL